MAKFLLGIGSTGLELEILSGAGYILMNAVITPNTEKDAPFADAKSTPSYSLDLHLSVL